MKFHTRSALFLAAMLLCSWLLPSPLWAGKRRVIDRIKVRVNEKVVTMLEVDELRNIQVNVLKTRLTGEELKKQLAALDKELIDRVVEDLLLESHAESLHIEISDQVIEARVDLILRRQPALAETYTDAQMKALVLKEILRQQVLAQEVNAHVRVTDEDVIASCGKVQGGNRQVDVGHILIRNENPESIQKIQAIRKLLEKGGDFSALALAHSQDPSVQTNNGRLGFISKGQFVKSFEDAAFSLPVGGLSQPVSTQFGFHLVKVFSERTRDKRDCKNLDKVTRQVFYNQLNTERKTLRLKTFLDGLRKKADIKIFD